MKSLFGGPPDVTGTTSGRRVAFVPADPAAVVPVVGRGFIGRVLSPPPEVSQAVDTVDVGLEPLSSDGTLLG